MSAVLLSAAVVVCALATQAAPAAKPDFSGRWIAVSPKEITGQRLTITQDTTSLLMEIVTPTVTHTARYNFDGKLREATSANKDLHGRLRVGAKWENDKLVLMDVIAAAHYSVLRAMSIDREGQLVLELRSPITGPDQEPGLHSESILETRRAVFKKVE